tara:strand:+ start:68 stop:487 length:420 start_codon:yes stop_codon:yes gene_type:complete
LSINNISRYKLKRIPLGSGDILHAMKINDPGYLKFGEIYFSSINYKSVKAWKRHKLMTLNLVVPFGDVKFAFFDDKNNRHTDIIGDSNYIRLTVPPGIWFGFKGLKNPFSLVMNLADIPHDPVEVERKDFKEFNYDWND